jgi:hypothetical protein
MFNAQNFPLVIVAALVIVAYASFLSVVLS